MKQVAELAARLAARDTAPLGSSERVGLRAPIGDPARPATRQVAAVAAGRRGPSSRAGAKPKPKARAATRKRSPKKRSAPPALGTVAALRVERKRLADLDPMPVNPRIELRPGMPRYENLKRSIERHGFVDPLVWNARTGHLVGGWQRRAVLLDLGFVEADVSVVEVDEEEERELNIVLNGVSGEWDYAALAAELQEFDDAAVLGFSAEDIEAIYRAAGLEEEAGGDGGAGRGFSDLERELAGLAGTEDFSITIVVPIEHAKTVRDWLANGELDTAAGRGRGILKRCGLL